MPTDNSGEATESNETDSGGSPSALREDTRDLLVEHYHIPILAALFSFMVAVRLQAHERFFTDGGIVFQGNDAWYHYRETAYVVENWPFTREFDPWTAYPDGTAVGHMGTLFDQIHATVALILGLGSPSDELVRTIAALAPPVWAALALIPTYLLAKRVSSSRNIGLLAAGFLALLPGTFLRYGLVGFYDHHVAEVLFMAFGIVAVLAAVQQANEDLIIKEVLADGDAEELKAWLGRSVVAGVAIAAYLLVWPPGVLLVGILALAFLAYAFTTAYQDGRTAEPALLTGAVAMSVVAILLGLNIEEVGFNVVGYSLLQVLMPAGVAAMCLFLIAFDRELERRDVSDPATTLVGSVSGGIAVTAGALYALAPDVSWMLWYNIQRTVALGTHAEDQTIGEAQPFVTRADQFFPAVFSEYGLLFFAAIGGLALILAGAVQRFRDGDDLAEDIVLLTWATIITLAAFTQVRFNYYLALIVAIFAAHLIGRVVRFANIPSTFPSLKGYQVIALVMVVLAIGPGLLFPAAGTAMVTAQDADPGEYTEWQDTLDWMEENTPAHEELDYHGDYERTESFEYPDGTYGVMSWWDYGHYTTAEAERIPFANPFQQNAEEAGQYLLADDEEEAAAVINDMDADAEARYVMVDWKMAEPSSKFLAQAVWNPDTEREDFVTPIYTAGPNGQLQYAMDVREQQYYESLVTRLYHYHGSHVEPSPVVIDYSVEEMDGQSVPVTNDVVDSKDRGYVVKHFQTMDEAESYVDENPSARIGGMGVHPTESVEALEHYRLVKAGGGSPFEDPQYQQALSRTQQFTEEDLTILDVNPHPAWVKVFERVPGAEVQGSGAPANTEVVAYVQMNDPATGQPFLYQQRAQTDENGEFTMTVPYSTTGYDEYGVDEGHTNPEVQAIGPYTFQTTPEDGGDTWQAESHVTEGQVLGEDDSPVTVELEKHEPEDDTETDETADSDDNSSDE